MAGDPEVAAVEALLCRAMAEYGQDRTRGDFLIRYACLQAADPLPLYRVIYKFHNRWRRFDLARDYAERALAEAARQGGLPPEPAAWTRDQLAAAPDDLASQSLLAIKAMAFIALRQGDTASAERHLALLTGLDPEDGSGVSVVQALAEGVWGGFSADPGARPGLDLGRLLEI